MNSTPRRIALILTIVLVAVGVDQATKYVARTSLRDAGRIDLIGTVVILTYAENTGAFLGLGSDWPPALRAAVFGLLSGLLVVAVIVYLFAADSLTRAQTIGLALLAGGGAGNMIDRIAYGGRVTDFMNLGIGRIRTGIFNAADIFIMAGAAVVVVGMLRQKE
jgi:signal peptidase II